jgi:non-specific serine/threonine protein kinase
VHDALAHLYDLPYLQTHPLTQYLRPSPAGVGSAAYQGQALRQSLLDGIAALGAADQEPAAQIRRNGRGHAILNLRYVEGLDVATIQAQLAISQSTYYREYQQAITALVSLLRERWRAAEEDAAAERAEWRGLVVGDVERAATDGSSLPGRIPLALTELIGREQEVAEVKGLVRTSRLVTLTGTGGCGKTRLAYQVATDLAREYADGAWVVELAALDDPGLVAPAVALALAVPTDTSWAPLATLSDYLRTRQVLLVLDNCEHLVEACAQLAAALLRQCARVTILATSRQSLGVVGEVSWRVPSLEAPDPEAVAVAGGDLRVRVSAYPAVRLFVERARAVSTAFALTGDNALAVARICRRLDGLPLAIELAAARVRAISPAQIARRIDDRFRLLVGSDRAGPPRHATLRAAVEWSHDLLGEAERIGFRRLAVFVGGWTLEAAEAICTATGIATAEVLDLVTSLVDKSLVIVEDGVDQTHYRYQETIREYALERLTESGEDETTRASHAAYYLSLADARAMAQLDRERDNVRATLRWFAEHGDIAAGMRVVEDMGEVWNQNGGLAEGKVWLERLRSTPEFASASLEVRAHALMAEVYLDVRLDPVAVRASCEKLQTLGREAANPAWQMFALRRLSWSSLELGELSRAEGELAQELALGRELGLPYEICHAQILLGDVARLRGDDDLARARYAESLATLDEGEAAWQRRCLGYLAVRRGELGEAESLFRDSTSIAKTLPNTLDQIECLGGFASLFVARGEAVRAARLLGAADAALQMIGLKLYFGDRFERDQTLRALRGVLGETAMTAAVAEGQTMTLEQAFACALGETAISPAGPKPVILT